MIKQMFILHKLRSAVTLLSIVIVVSSFVPLNVNVNIKDVTLQFVYIMTQMQKYKHECAQFNFKTFIHTFKTEHCAALAYLFVSIKHLISNTRFKSMQTEQSEYSVTS